MIPTILSLVVLATARSEPVTYAEKTIRGAPVRVIAVDLRDPGIKVGVQTCDGFPDGDEPFESMVARSHALAAVNGAYFGKTDHHPIGDIVVDGRMSHTGLMGTALAIKKDGAAEIRRVVPDRHQDWSQYETVLACGPALVLGGQCDVHTTEERFGSYVTNPGQRMCVGLADPGKLMMVQIRKAVSFEEAAEIMRGLGCYAAMNLDGGASLAMFYKGKVLQPAHRRLTNLLIVTVRH